MARRTFEIALLDGDLIAFRAAAASQKQLFVAKDDQGEILAVSQTKTPLKEGLEDKRGVSLEYMQIPDPDNYAYHKVNLQMEEILEVVGTTDQETYLSGHSFRRLLFPEYKAQRKKHAKPYHIKNCGDFLENRWGGKIYQNLEADDVLSIRARESDKDTTVIVSYDKDLRQIPGWHYNFKTGDLDWVSQQDADYLFWTQMLTGDSADNIPGLPRYGPKKALKILDGKETWDDLEAAVMNEYEKVHKDEWNKHWCANFDMLRLLETWDDVENVYKRLKEVG